MLSNDCHGRGRTEGTGTPGEGHREQKEKHSPVHSLNGYIAEEEAVGGMRRSQNALSHRRYEDAASEKK